MAKENNQARALAALLDADSFTSAATAAGISRRQLFNYLHSDKEFALEYRRLQSMRTIERAEQAAADREAALQILRDVMNDEAQNGAIRVKAALALLERGDKASTDETSVAQDILNSHSTWFEL